MSKKAVVDIGLKMARMVKAAYLGGGAVSWAVKGMAVAPGWKADGWHR